MSASNRRFYAGIGSRDTPDHVQEKMTEIAKLLERRRYTLRSGGAIGSDTAFENGVIANKEIFLTDQYVTIDGLFEYKKEDLDFANDAVNKYHPLGKKMKGDKRKLLARNTFQIFGVGSNTINSDFVICYTSDGAEAATTKETGGTGQAIRIAYDYGIPVYNLKNYIGVTAEEMVEFILKEVANERSK